MQVQELELAPSLKKKLKFFSDDEKAKHILAIRMIF
jgi:hypothetical protein